MGINDSILVRSIGLPIYWLNTSIFYATCLQLIAIAKTSLCVQHNSVTAYSNYKVNCTITVTTSNKGRHMKLFSSIRYLFLVTCSLLFFSFSAHAKTLSLTAIAANLSQSYSSITFPHSTVSIGSITAKDNKLYLHDVVINFTFPTVTGTHTAKEVVLINPNVTLFTQKEFIHPAQLADSIIITQLATEEKTPLSLLKTTSTVKMLTITAPIITPEITELAQASDSLGYAQVATLLANNMRFASAVFEGIDSEHSSVSKTLLGAAHLKAEKKEIKQFAHGKADAIVYAHPQVSFSGNQYSASSFTVNKVNTVPLHEAQVTLLALFEPSAQGIPAVVLDPTLLPTTIAQVMAIDVAFGIQGTDIEIVDKKGQPIRIGAMQAAFVNNNRQHGLVTVQNASLPAKTFVKLNAFGLEDYLLKDLPRVTVHGTTELIFKPNDKVLDVVHCMFTIDQLATVEMKGLISTEKPLDVLFGATPVTMLKTTVTLTDNSLVTKTITAFAEQTGQTPQEYIANATTKLDKAASLLAFSTTDSSAKEHIQQSFFAIKHFVGDPTAITLDITPKAPLPLPASLLDVTNQALSLIRSEELTLSIPPPPNAQATSSSSK